MPIDAMHKELLIRMSLFLGNEDHKQLSCTAKPFKNLDIEKALCSERVMIDHSLLMKIRRYHNEIMKIRADEISSSATSSKQTDNHFDTGHCQSKKFKKTDTPNAEQQKTVSNTSAIKELSIANDSAIYFTDDDLIKLIKLGFIHAKTETIKLVNCTQITNLEPIKNCKALIWLVLDYCNQIDDQFLRTIPTFPLLKDLDLEDCTQITDLGAFVNCTTLQSLYLGGCTKIRNTGTLTSLTKLTELYLTNCPQVNNQFLRTIPTLPIIEILDLVRCTKITDIRPLESCTKLAFLKLDCLEITDLSPLKNCTALIELSLAGCCEIRDLEPLKSCKLLEKIDHNECHNIQHIEPLKNHARLRHLNMTRCDQISDLSPLESCKKLEELDLTECWGIRSLKPLEECTALRGLRLWGCDEIEEIEPLANCKRLTYLYLDGCDQITDLSPFANHPSLSELTSPDGEEVDLTSLSNTQQPGP